MFMIGVGCVCVLCDLCWFCCWFVNGVLYVVWYVFLFIILDGDS